MIELTKIKYCPELDEGLNIGDNTDGHVKVMLDKYVLDFEREIVCDEAGNKEKLIVIYKDYDHTTSRFYLWQKLLVNWLIEKGYKAVVFQTDYVNIDVQTTRAYTDKLQYPEERLMSGVYCQTCIKREECPELKEAYLGSMHFEIDKGDITQLFNAYTLISTRRKAIEETEKQMKDIIYERIDGNQGVIVMPKLGIKLLKKEINKDTLTYGEVRSLGLADDSTCSVRITAVKDKLKKDKILASKVKFTVVPFRTELEIKNV